MLVIIAWSSCPLFCFSPPSFHFILQLSYTSFIHQEKERVEDTYIRWRTENGSSGSGTPEHDPAEVSFLVGSWRTYSCSIMTDVIRFQWMVHELHTSIKSKDCIQVQYFPMILYLDVLLFYLTGEKLYPASSSRPADNREEVSGVIRRWRFIRIFIFHTPKTTHLSIF